MRRILFFTSLVVCLFLILFVWQWYKFSDKKLHVVFCSVGQGDGIFIRTPSGKAIIVDGGPDKKILDCLSSHMPFWQRSIDVMVLSHPHADHLNGLRYVVNNYYVRYFAKEPLDNATSGHRGLLSSIQTSHIPTKELLAGDRINVGDGVLLSVLGPSKQFLQRTSPKGSIGESSEFGSLILQLSYGDFDVLLTGDSQVAGMKEALKTLRSFQGKPVGIEVLQAPHHGSRFGLDKALIKAIAPKLAVISVGKNKYGHPAPFTMGLFNDAKVLYMRTDKEGDIELVSDGKSWGVKR